MADPLSMIAATVSQVKTILDFGKGILALKMDEKVRERVGELLDTIAALRERIFEINQKVEEEHREYMQLKDWRQNTEANYALKELAVGTFVYEYKTLGQGSEPAHYLCPVCYQRREKSILQATRHDEYIHVWNCLSCKSTLSVRLKEESTIISTPHKSKNQQMLDLYTDFP